MQKKNRSEVTLAWSLGGGTFFVVNLQCLSPPGGGTLQDILE